MAMNFFRKKSKQDEEKHDWKTTGSFIRKPVKGWLHSDRLLEGSGVTYEAKYVGAIQIVESMRNVPFEQRGAVVRDAISKCCLESKMYNFKPSKVSLTHGVVGPVDLRFSSKMAMVTFSKSHVKIVDIESGEVFYKHAMECISFASLGENQYENLVAYVSKDSRLERACFVVECAPGLANDLILTIGQAFELKYKEYLNRNPVILPSVARFTDPSNASSFRMENTYEETTPKNHTYDNHEMDSSNTNPDDQQYDHLVNNSKRKPSEPDDSEYNTLNMNANSKIVSNKEEANGFDFAPGASYMGTDGNVATVYDNPIAASNAKGKVRKPPRANVPQNDKYKSPNNRPANIKVNNDAPIANQQEDIYLAPSPSNKIQQVIPEATPVAAMATPPTAPTPTAPPRTKHQNRLKISEDIQNQPWFHGVLSREHAEGMITSDGEFLVRESGGSKGQYVLTGMRNGTHRHLLLVDPEGKVRTRDHSFDTVAGLIAYHKTHNIPICSGASEVYLIHDIHDLRRDVSQSFAI